MKNLILVAFIGLLSACKAGDTLQLRTTSWNTQLNNTTGSNKNDRTMRAKGSFRNGEAHGQGIITNPDGRRYKVEFREGEIQGRAKPLDSEWL